MKTFRISGIPQPHLQLRSERRGAKSELAVRSSAFTLLELMVSMAVLSLIIVLLLSIVDNATTMWRQSENRVDAYREARAALNVIANDLASIYRSSNTNFFRLDDPSIVIDAPPPASLDDPLFFLTALPTGAQDPDSNKSYICAVGYFLGYNSTSLSGNSKEKSLNLYRYFKSSDNTYEVLTNSSPSLVTKKLTTGRTGEEVLAKNVTHFNVKAFTFSETLPLATPELVPFVQSPATPIPDMIEISLGAISNDSAKKLTSLTDWTDSNSPLIKENLRTFTKRVVLRSTAAPTPTPAPSP